jgi:hypothetical protein
MERSPRDASKGQAAMVQAEGRRLICQALSAGCLLRRRPRVARGCLWRTKPRPAALSGILSRVRERLLPTSAYWARKASPPLCQRHIEKTTASRPALTRSCAPTATNDGSCLTRRGRAGRRNFGGIASSSRSPARLTSSACFSHSKRRVSTPRSRGIIRATTTDSDPIRLFPGGILPLLYPIMELLEQLLGLVVVQLAPTVFDPLVELLLGQIVRCRQTGCRQQLFCGLKPGPAAKLRG